MLYRSIILCLSSILAPSAASSSDASFPHTPVWDLTCSILTSVPLLWVSSRYSFLSRVASAWLALVCLLFGTVLPVAMLMAYALSTRKVTLPSSCLSPCTALSRAVRSPALYFLVQRVLVTTSSVYTKRRAVEWSRGAGTERDHWPLATSCDLAS